MSFKKLSYLDHIKELKSRIIKTLVFLLMAICISYFFIEDIYRFLLIPLKKLRGSHKIIYTGLADVFLSYIYLALRVGACLTIPFFNYQLYQFIAPGLHKRERQILCILLFFSPILFLLGGIFVFSLIIPKAWSFFVSFEQNNLLLPLMLEARINEYIELTSKFIIAFGLAFQMPIILILFVMLGIISRKKLIENRRVAIIVNFIIAAILTPPDIFSQFALAIPLIILYEISIFITKFTGTKC